MGQTPGSIDVKLNIDTTEARAQIAALREEARAIALKPEEVANYRLRALELAIGSSDQRGLLATRDFLDRASQFAEFIAGS